MSFASSVLENLNSLDRSSADSSDFGIVEVDDAGVIKLYNKYESDLASIAPDAAEGKNFFTQVAPCTNNRLFYGRFQEGVKGNDLNAEMDYVFTYKMRPTRVKIHMYRDPREGRNFVFVKKNA